MTHADHAIHPHQIPSMYHDSTNTISLVSHTTKKQEMHICTSCFQYLFINYFIPFSLFLASFISCSLLSSSDGLLMIWVTTVFFVLCFILWWLPIRSAFTCLASVIVDDGLGSVCTLLCAIVAAGSSRAITAIAAHVHTLLTCNNDLLIPNVSVSTNDVKRVDTVSQASLIKRKAIHHFLLYRYKVPLLFAPSYQ